jgi:DNA-binding NtrC family response regulator
MPRILIVDEGEVELQLFSLILKAADFEIVTARSPEDVQNILRDDLNFDVALINSMDLKKFAMYRLPIPVIVYQVSQAVNVEQQNIIGYIPFPVNTKEMPARILAAIKRGLEE